MLGITYNSDRYVCIHMHTGNMLEFTNAILLNYTAVPQSFWLILHSSEVRFISSGHLRKTIVSQSDESDLCLSTIRSVSDLHLVPSSGHFRLIRSRPTRQTLT